MSRMEICVEESDSDSIGDEARAQLGRHNPSSHFQSGCAGHRNHNSTKAVAAFMLLIQHPCRT